MYDSPARINSSSARSETSVLDAWTFFPEAPKPTIANPEQSDSPYRGAPEIELSPFVDVDERKKHETCGTGCFLSWKISCNPKKVVREHSITRHNPSSYLPGLDPSPRLQIWIGWYRICPTDEEGR